MAQLGRFDYAVQTVLGLAVSGASIAVYREGATVNGAQSGTAPLTVTVRHPGKIAAGDAVFIGTTTGTTYAVNSTTATTVVLSGFVGTLALSGGDRLTPGNSQPTLYSDDQGGATSVNPLAAGSTGRAQCWMQDGAYDFIVSGAGLATTAFTGQVIVGESPTVRVSGEFDSSTAVAHAEDTYFSMATAGAKLKSFRNLGTEKAAIDKDGTGMFPRLGQTSTATTGGALRIIDGNVFPITVAGVQAALNECESAGGGTVIIPSGANITLATTSIKIPNRVKLMGTVDHSSNPTFTANASTNVSAMVENKTQDGTQQYAYVEGIYINGNKASGATVTRGLNLKAVYVGSRVKDVLISNCSGNGLVFDGSTAAVGLGQMMMDNVTVTGCSDHNILVTGPVDSLYGFQITSESVAVGKAMMKITNATATASSGHVLIGVHFEGTVASDGLVLDGCSSTMVHSITDNGNGSALNLVKITGATAGSDGAFASGGHVIQNASANLTTIIDDQVSGVTIGNAQGRFVRWYSSPVASATLDTAQIVGLQPQRVGVSIIAAATITPGEGSYFVVTGNTGVNSVTATARDKGRIIILNFSGTPTIADGSNLKLAGNLVATADDTLTLVCDGTNWIEMCRSIN